MTSFGRKSLGGSFGISSISFGKMWRQIVGEQCTSPTVQVEHNGEILPFGIYAACRLLNTVPSNKGDSQVFEAVRTLSCLYLRADVQGITDCVAAFGLDALLSQKIQEYKVFQSSHSAAAPMSWSMNLVMDLLTLLEALLVEYFGHGWDKVDKVLTANEADLKEEGMVCVWNPNKNRGNGFGVADRPPTESRARRNWKRAYRVAIKQVAMKTLGTQRHFATFAQIAQELNRQSSNTAIADLNQNGGKRRNPILLLLGGGMAAGKSTVREIIGSDDFWSKVCKEAVIVEADAIKNQDIVFQVLSGRLGNDPSVSALVHEYSTAAAESMLVAAVNDQLDIVFDGTMTWLPFVEQTIAMVRDHKHRYVRGPGYHKTESGEIREEYWKPDVEYDEEKLKEKLPYRIEIVGVTCDPGLAVGRGIWRKLRTGRGVPISSQLRSHRLFSENFEKIAKLVDSATLYHTGTCLTTFTHTETIAPKIIAHSSNVTRGEMLVNPPMWNEFLTLKDTNDNANSRATLFKKSNRGPPSRTFTRALNNLGAGSNIRATLQEAHKKGTQQ
ncbi:hypothetical protein BSKO_04468 [Bryopsis sp. KO-2023]|nr:hypothetical protein BSKO_04468 [Bryopsis sp. KO-2023]